MADVKLLASQRLTDNPDGGGLMTSIEIVDGVVNNLWPDVSRVDRAYGVVNLRKLYCKADTADTAIYSGMHIIFLTPPQDPRVSVTMFSTNSWADERADAQSAMERYLDESVTTRLIPFDRQLAGQRTILGFQRPELDLPNIGEVYVITSLPDETVSQFVRVSNLDHNVQTFTDPDSGQDFKARVITLTLSEPLLHTFQGSVPTKFFTPKATGSQIRKTIVSDAVNYHTVHPIAVDAEIGDITIKLGSVYAQLVPASTSEAAVLDASPGAAVVVVPSGTAHQKMLFLSDNTGGYPITGFTSTAITPGSVYMELDNHDGGVRAVDDGAGNLRSLTTTGSIVGSVDYIAGSITVNSQFNGGGTTVGVGCGYYFIPAAAVSTISQTFQLPVTQSTRGYVYTATLHPTPVPGNLSVAFRALGRWYVLQDDGSGALVGEIGVGTGTINFLSGSLAVTLGALPDIGSSVIISWGGSTQYEIKVGDVTVGNPVVRATLPEGNCVPSSLTVTWAANGVTKSASDDGSEGFTGDATGRVIYANGEIAIKPTVLPDPDTTFHFAYQTATVRTEISNPTKSGATITLTAAHVPVRPKSILITYDIATARFGVPGFVAPVQFTDNGGGVLVSPSGLTLPGSTVDYTTGVIVFNPDYAVIGAALSYESFSQNVPARTIDPTSGFFSPNNVNGLWPVDLINAGDTISFINSTAVTLQYKQDSVTDGAATYDVVEPPIAVDLTPTVRSTVVPGGVMFTLGGRTFVDRAGSLYYGVSSTTNAGILGGSIDYSSGLATITNWVANASSTLTLDALLVQLGELPCTVVTGRTPGSPLRPGSFYMQANKLDGTLISATADSDGNIDTATMHGYVDVTTGVYSVAFGAYVLDSSLTSDDKLEPWYDSGNVSGGYIFRPLVVLPSSIKYNCVVQTSLPLDSTILGIDPVRLPLDGRVQAVREGYMGIFHDTQVTTLAGGLVADQVLTLPRDALALVEVRDQTGAVVLGQTTTDDPVMGAKFTTDLAAGTIKMANPLDLSGFTQPLVATHRIEDASVVTGVQITGHVTMAEPLTHAYTADNSLFSTALIAPFVGGSVQGVYTHLFTQQTWNNSAPNWTDAAIGGGTTANVDDLNFPIQVLDRDAITEKWAFVFTSGTTFNIVGQDVGVIGTGNTSTDVSPTNPGTTHPYFLFDHRAFGSGWATGNAIRFDTQGAGMPVWLARTVKSGPATYTDDRDVIEPRWDKS